MTSLEGLSRLEARNIDGLYVASDDSDNRLRVSREFSEWFAMEPVTEGELGLPLGRRAAGAQHDQLAMLRNATIGILVVGVLGAVRKAAGQANWELVTDWEPESYGPERPLPLLHPYLWVPVTLS